MKKVIVLLLVCLAGWSSTTFAQAVDTSLIEEVTKVLIEGNLDQRVLDSLNLKLEGVEISVKDVVLEAKEMNKPINSPDAFWALVTVLFAFVNNILTQLTKVGLKLTKKKTIATVIAFGGALALSMTALKGDFQIVEFLTGWLFTSGGAALFFEKVLRPLFGEKKTKIEAESAA